MRVVLFLILLIHAVGILLPEVGFDALWYHLPIVRDMAVTHAIRAVPGIPQSDQPRLGEVVFTPGFLLAHETGVKFTTYVVMLVLIGLSYKLARVYLDSKSALLITILIATFHTIAWQATSAYVDLLRAVFEVGLIYVLVRKEKLKHDALIILLLLAGALLTKLVTLLFLPSFLLLIYFKRGIKICVMAIVLATLIYGIGHYPINFFFTTGHALIGTRQILASLRSLFLLPLELSFHRESYLSPIFLLATPFAIYKWRALWIDYKELILYLSVSFTTWVFVIPISVRYDLSAIILTTILCGVVLRPRKQLLVFMVVISVVFNMSMRLGALWRAREYLFSNQTEAEYLERYDKGILKGPLESWYNINKL